MMRDIEEWVFVAIIIGSIALIGFMFMQSAKMDDCYNRGGHVIDTPNGWVCAKLEKV